MTIYVEKLTKQPSTLNTAIKVSRYIKEITQVLEHVTTLANDFHFSVYAATNVFRSLLYVWFFFCTEEEKNNDDTPLENMTHLMFIMGGSHVIF